MADNKSPLNGDHFALIIGLMIFSAVINLLVAFWLMLGLGVAHGIWLALPAPGYWETYLMSVALTTLARAIIPARIR